MITRSLARRRGAAPPLGQAGDADAAAEAEAPRRSRAAFRPGVVRVVRRRRARIASTGQAFTHLPQPLQRSASTSGRKLVVWTGCRKPKRFARRACASQQQPQQLQMKASRSRTFSPNCTRPALAGLVEEVEPLGGVDLPGVAVLRRARRRWCRTSGRSRSGASQARPTCCHLVPAVAEADADRGGRPRPRRSPARSRGPAAPARRAPTGSLHEHPPELRLAAR